MKNILTNFKANIGVFFAALLIIFASTSQTFAAIVINEVYGGGGNTNAPYNQDFIELYNNGATNIDLTGYSIQYAAATGTSWTACTITGANLIVAPGNYFLIAVGAVGANGIALPTPNATCSGISMSATAGKVALVSNTTALTGACPTGGGIVDFVGYGTTANCSETSNAPAPSNTTSISRTPTGTDTGNNSTDFTSGSPSPFVLTAASAAISGRVTTANGRGIRNVRLVLSGGNLTAPLYTQSTPFGFYRFEGLSAGETYIVTVYSKSYYFGQTSRVITLQDNVTNADFVAEERLWFGK